MPSLIKAYGVALGMGRNPSLLGTSRISVSTFGKGADFGGNCIVFRTDVIGGNDPHSVVLVIENQHPQLELWKPMSLKRMEKSRWHCDCSDFRFTFYPYLDNNDFALYPFPLYIPNGRGKPRAIEDYGMCKHVMALVNDLVRDRALSPFSFDGD